MQITVLGKSPAWQDAGGACSGYLVEEAGYRLLVDCGNGAFGKLRQVLDYVDVDAVVISHLHADHFFDLVPFASALVYAPRQQPVPVDRWPGTEFPARPRLLAPQGAHDTFRAVCEAGGMFPDHLEKAFHVEEYAEADEPVLGPLRLRFHTVPHYVRTHAIEITSPTGRLTYGADHAPSPELAAFAQGTDLLLIEATLPRPERAGPRGHVTPREAGEHAATASAKRLVLTHISDELDSAWATQEAADVFPGPVEVARELAVYEV